MSTGYAHELPVGEPDGAVADALAEVGAGEIAYLTRGGEPIAALVPIAELAELQHALDAAEIAEADAMRRHPGARIPHEIVEAMMAADDGVHDAMAAALDARAGEDVSPDEVRAIWETITARRGA
jgi:antitoxin (DNA-binding transcriptional repressor) of toxin-antitoxin stability system